MRKLHFIRDEKHLCTLRCYVYTSNVDLHVWIYSTRFKGTEREREREVLQIISIHCSEGPPLLLLGDLCHATKRLCKISDVATSEGGSIEQDFKEILLFEQVGPYVSQLS